MDGTQWGPGLVVVGLAMSGAAVFAFVNRRRERPAIPIDERTAELEKEAELALERLARLEDDATGLAPEELASERTRLEAEAAAALKARDAHRASRAAATGSSAPAGEPSSALSPASHHLLGAAWGAALTAAIVALLGGWNFGGGAPATVSPADARAAGDPGAPAGEAAAAHEGEAATTDEEWSFQHALARAKSEPGNADAVALVGHELIRRERWSDASEVTEASLAIVPGHAENLVHRAVLKAMLKHDARGALEDLEQLAKAHPDTYEALLFAGILALEDRQNERALANLERYWAVAKAEERPAQLQHVLDSLRAAKASDGAKGAD